VCEGEAQRFCGVSRLYPRNQIFESRTAKPERLDGHGAVLNGIVISTVDSMESRKAIWEAVHSSFGVDLYIDARMGGELLRLYALNPLTPEDADEYVKTLYSDKEALELPCTAQTIIYTGFVAGSLIANTVRRHVSGERPTFEVVFDLTSYTLLTR